MSITLGVLIGFRVIGSILYRIIFLWNNGRKPSYDDTSVVSYIFFYYSDCDTYLSYDSQSLDSDSSFNSKFSSSVFTATSESGTYLSGASSNSSLKLKKSPSPPEEIGELTPLSKSV